MFVLYSQNYAAMALLILFNTSKKAPTQIKLPQKILAKFSYPKKIPESKISNPKKILRSSPSLEIPSTLPVRLGEVFHCFDADRQ